MYKKTKTVSIVGYGRFGKVLHRLLSSDFRINVYDKSGVRDRSLFIDEDRILTNVKEIYSSEVVFFAVPIEKFEKVIVEHKKYFKESNLLVDVLSVKLHPQKVLEKYLNGTKTQAILTHPMFGPDSSREGFNGLPMIMDKFRSKESNYKFWKEYFKDKKLNVIEMSPKKHDKLAANSQGLTHLLGRVLDSYGLKPTPIDSLGAKKLMEVKEQTCNDTWELFTNLQHYNPYTAKMRIKMGSSFDKLYNKLLPSQINPKSITFGIQGGVGSFNEEALSYYVKKSGLAKVKTKYLYTSENVMSELHKGKIDQGQFAIHNSTGGMVGESIEAMARYKFKIVDQFAIKISHALMIRSDANLSDISTIMTHPQVLAQCRETLIQKYPNLKQTSGEGTLVDHALVAKRLFQKKLPKNIAVMGSKVLASIYNLQIVEDNLQDLKNNYTTFLHVKRT